MKRQILVDYDKLCDFIEMLDGGAVSDDERMSILIEETGAVIVDPELEEMRDD